MTLRIAVLAIFTVATLHGATISVTDTVRGWVTSPGGPNETATATANYLTGYSNTDEYRNFFKFVLPTFAGTVQSVDLLLFEPASGVTGSSTYAVYSSVSAPTFSTVTAGTQLGQIAITTASDGKTLDISLSPLSGFTSGATVYLGGQITNLNVNFDDQNTFIGSQTGSSSTLQIVTAASVSTPEPATAILILAGGLALMFLKRKSAAGNIR